MTRLALDIEKLPQLLRSLIRRMQPKHHFAELKQLDTIRELRQQGLSDDEIRARFLRASSCFLIANDWLAVLAGEKTQAEVLGTIYLKYATSKHICIEGRDNSRYFVWLALERATIAQQKRVRKDWQEARKRGEEARKREEEARKREEQLRLREIERFTRAQQLAEENKRRLTQTIVYIMDGLNLGYDEATIEETLPVDDADYLKLCFHIAKQNRIKRQIELNRRKLEGPYAISESINRVAGELHELSGTLATTLDQLSRSNLEVALALDRMGHRIRQGLEHVAEGDIEVAGTLDKLGYRIQQGLGDIAKSNLETGKRLAESNIRAAEVVGTSIGEIAAENRRLNNFRERIYEEAQRAKITPIVDNLGTDRDILLVNNYSGKSTIITGASIYQDGQNYIIHTYEGVMVLPKHAFSIFDPRWGSITDFRNSIGQLPSGSR